MDKEPLIVHRKKGPAWNFEWSAEYNGYVCRGAKHLYKIFFPCGGELMPHIWIGLLVNNGWVTWERELGAVNIHFGIHGIYYFDKEREVSCED